MLPAPAIKEMLLHIPKTGGISLRRVVETEYPRDRCVWIYSLTDEDLAEAKAKAPHAHAFYGHYWFGFHELMGVRGRYSTVVREPIARVASHYRQLRRMTANGEPHRWSEQFEAGVSLRELIESGTCEGMNNQMVRILAAYEPIAPTDDDAVLDAALANLEASFHMVGLTEQLDRSLELFRRGLGWSRRPRLERLNVSEPSEVDDLDAGTLAVVRDHNRLDLMLYRHAVERFEALCRDYGLP